MFLKTPILDSLGNRQNNSLPTNNTSSHAFICTVAAVYFIAYLIRYVYLYYFISRNYSFSEINPEWNPILLSSLNQSFYHCSVILGLFFLSTLYGRSKYSNLQIRYSLPSSKIQLTLLIFVAVCSVVRFIFGAQLGEQTIALPFGITAVVNRSISELIPGLILLMMEVFWINGQIRGYRFWLFTLAIFNIGIAAIAASKAGMVFFAAELILFMYLTGQPLFQKPLRWIIIAGLALAAFIVGSEIRSQTIGGSSSEYLVLLDQGDYAGTLLLVLGTLVNRIIGLEGYALSCGYSCSTLPDFIIPGVMSFFGEAGDIFTQQVVRVQRDFDYRSPGLLGGAALITGIYGGAILVIGFLRGCVTVLRISDRRTFSVAFKVSLIFGLFRFIVEGTWDIVNLIALGIGAIMVEILSRRLRPQIE